jgi:hypothetical protein
MNIELVMILVRSNQYYDLDVAELFTAEAKKPDQLLEKNICMGLVEFLKKDKSHFGGGEGEWQCIIGKNLAASLIYELHMLTFFDMPDFGRSILVFKSG